MRREITPSVAAVGELQSLLEDWRRHLRAKNLSPTTIDSYLIVGRAFSAYLTSKGMPTDAGHIAREHVEAYVADMLDRLSAATAAKHYRSLQQFFRWLADEGEIPRSPMERMSPPAVPEQPVPVITGEEITKLLTACAGTTGLLHA